MNFNTILAKIKPSKEEEQHLHKVVKHILAKIKIKQTKAILGGSGAKNTWLRGTHDIDIYVKFNYHKYKDKSDQLADILEKTLKRHFKIDRLHGSRDYFQIHYPPAYTVEIVPILGIQQASQAKNITDCSQLHVQYVQKHKKLADDIRVAKQFAKAQKVYGAESYIQGFSGYVMELLVIHYGSFMKLVRAAAKWKQLTIIGSKKAAEKLNAAKKSSPLIIIDPVQADRNAAAAISQEKYQQFSKACKQFLKHPSEKFFEVQEVNFEALKKKGKVLYCSIVPLQGKKDVVGAKMRKAFEYIHRQLQEKDFHLITAGWQYEAPSYFYFVVDKKPLSTTMLRKGPPMKNKEAVKHFTAQHKHTSIKKGHLYATVPRSFIHPEDCLQVILQSPNVRDRLQTITWQVL